MPDSTPPEKLSFEQALEELESLVQALDNNRLPLAEMLQNYQRGAELLAACRQQLESAQQRVQLIAAGRHGATLQTFDPATENNTSSAPSPSAKPAPRRGAKAPSPEDDEIRLF